MLGTFLCQLGLIGTLHAHHLKERDRLHLPQHFDSKMLLKGIHCFACAYLPLVLFHFSSPINLLATPIRLHGYVKSINFLSCLLLVLYGTSARVILMPSFLATSHPSRYLSPNGSRPEACRNSSF